MSDYQRIAKAMAFIADNLSSQPGLEEIAAHSGLSQFHFQRIFCRWAGTTPKRFQQILTLERGKTLLDESYSLLDTTYALGLSSSSRLHDHFIQIEAITPGEYKRKGQGLTIKYGIDVTPFGPLFMALTSRGIHRAVFIETNEIEQELARLKAAWPHSQLERNDAAIAKISKKLFNPEEQTQSPLTLHIKGTNFQVAVWKALLRIPQGQLTTYSAIAKQIGRPKSSRAVGNAIGANPVALFIPCHRVIQQSGALGGYRWQPQRKIAIQLWEQAQIGQS